jgi:Phage integrase family
VEGVGIGGDHAHRTLPIPPLRREPWNKGRPIGQNRPLKPKDVWTIRVRLQLEGRKRDLAMFNLAVDSKLRGCDLVRLKIDDVSAGGRVRDRATVIQKKTGRTVQFEITEQTRGGIEDWLSSLGGRRGQYLFPSRFRKQAHLSTRQCARIVHRWVERAGLDSWAYGTHSMRRTKPAQIYKKTGNLRAVQLLLGHTMLESTVRHLEIELDDALSISEQVELLTISAAWPFPLVGPRLGPTMAGGAPFRTLPKAGRRASVAVESGHSFPRDFFDGGVPNARSLNRRQMKVSGPCRGAVSEFRHDVSVRIRQACLLDRQRHAKHRTMGLIRGGR